MRQTGMESTIHRCRRALDGVTVNVPIPDSVALPGLHTERIHSVFISPNASGRKSVLGAPLLQTDSVHFEPTALPPAVRLKPLMNGSTSYRIP